MKKFYKSGMFLSMLAGVALLIPIGYIMMSVGEKYGLIWSFGERFFGGGFIAVGLFAALGVSNFLGSRFTLPRKWDFITSSLPVFLLLPAMLICIATIVGAVILGSQSPWILMELYSGIALVLLIFLGGAFLRGMADDDRQEWECKKVVYQQRRERKNG